MSLAQVSDSVHRYISQWTHTHTGVSSALRRPNMSRQRFLLFNTLNGPKSNLIGLKQCVLMIWGYKSKSLRLKTCLDWKWWGLRMEEATLSLPPRPLAVYNHLPTPGCRHHHHHHHHHPSQHNHYPYPRIQFSLIKVDQWYFQIHFVGQDCILK